MSELTKEIKDQLGLVLTQFKETREELNTKYDGLVQESLNKQTEALTQIAEQKSRLDSIEAATQRLAEIGVSKSGENKDDDKEVKKFDEYLRKGAHSDARGQIELKTLREASDPDGGYLVRPALVNKIITKVFETSPIRPYASVLASRVPVPFLTDLGEIESGWVSEQGARTAGNTPTFGEIMLDPHEQYALVPVTQRLLDNASVDLEGWISRKASDKFSRVENTAFLSGDGVGKPKGLLSTAYTFTSSYTDHTNGTVEIVKSGSNGAFTVDGLMNLIGAVKPEYASASRLYIHRKGFYKLLQLKSTDNYHLIDPLTLFFGSTDMQKQGPMIPVTFWNDLTAPANYTTGTYAAIYGDIGQAYQILDGLGMTLLRDPYTDKPRVLFYFYKRVDGGVINFDAYKVHQLSA